LNSGKVPLAGRTPQVMFPPEKMFNILNHQGNANQNNPEITKINNENHNVF
jgi:hypothetical protein